MKQFVKKIIITALLIPVTIAMTAQKPLPRVDPQNQNVDIAYVNQFLEEINKENMELHSLMILRNGKVVYEQWFGDNSARIPHVMNSVSKTFTATAVGFAVSEGLLSVTDKVISFFPDQLPATVGDNLKEMKVKDLLTMTAGSDEKKIRLIQKDSTKSWVEAFLAVPVVHKPGTVYEYSSLSTYMLSAIIQKLTSEKLVDYLAPRLFVPLGITGVRWVESPEGITFGGSGLYVRTEDMAKLGQLFLQKGKWGGKQILPASWIEEASSYQVASFPSGTNAENITPEIKEGDWIRGYGYQMWRCRHNAYRADGARGQFIIILPDKEGVIVTTANIDDMQAELNLIWTCLLPAFN